MVSQSSPLDSRATEADPPTFDVIFREHFDYVWRVGRTWVGPELADDVCQEVLLLVRRKLPEFAGTSIRAWLYGITRNVARNAARAHRRRRQRHRAIPQPAASTGQQRWSDVQEAADLMDRFLRRLPDAQREAFVLKEIEEMTAAEIAEAIGAPLQTVYSRVRAARAALEEFRRGLDSPGGVP